jgi:protein-tyrosine phosphatase
MPELFDWQQVADPHAVIGSIVQALQSGRLVGLPTESGYGLVASGLSAAAVEQLRSVQPDQPCTLAVRGAAEARSWAPGLSPLGQRMVRRFWPGPLTLQVRDAEQGLLSRLSADVRRHISPDQALRMRAPAHEAILEVLRQLAGPLLLASPAAPAQSPSQLLEAAGDHVSLVLDDGPSSFAEPPTLVEVNGSSWQVLQPGVLSAELLQAKLGCLIVFVCTGNTCRSPLAEALCKKRLADRLGCAVEELPARGFFVCSAGLAAMIGGGAAPEALEVARVYGADLAGHQSQALSRELVAQADYLVAMTQSHVQAIAERFAPQGVRPRLLDPQGGDLADPLGGDQEVYNDCGKQIWNCVEALVTEVQS